MDRTKRILKVLEKRPEGLTTNQLAQECGASRVTIVADLRELVGSGNVQRRQIGTARVYYSKEKGDTIWETKHALNVGQQ